MRCLTRVDAALPRRVTLAAIPLDCLCPSSLFTAGGRQARRAEGAPLKPQGKDGTSLSSGPMQVGSLLAPESLPESSATG